MADKKHFIRILLIEDDKNRVKKIESWLPGDVRLVHAASAGRVLGILKRDKNQYAGIMLDHDLQLQAATANDTELSGSTVVKWIRDLISPDVPVLVHSMNHKLAPVMVKALEDGGFSVTRIPMEDMIREHFLSWLEEVRECWEDHE
jgi:CheY-like chemotaxis protein